MSCDLKIVRTTKISIKEDPHLNESWLQDQIARDPSILGLGDLILRDRERPQPRAGRLDLLLQDPDSSKRYEVEIQLGKMDESHIIRTIEYWDLERKRYPQYEHCAVIIAEDVTSRFLNIISLFNGFIPLIAIQFNAYRLHEEYFLTFTTILDEVQLGLFEEDEEVQEIADRSYWEAERGTRETVSIVDEVLEIITSLLPGYELKYNKFYIGLARRNQVDNFIIFRPRKRYASIEVRLQRSEEIEGLLEDHGLDLMDYDKRNGRYRIILKPGSVDEHRDVLQVLIRKSKDLEEPSSDTT